MTDADLTRSERLTALLRAEIQHNGPICFERFMERCLYEPELGYYAHAETGFAEQGDFATAPTLTPLFSECLAEQIAELVGSLKTACLVEYGAGNGALAASLWPALQARGVDLHRYLIVETSAALRNIQRQTLRNSGGPFNWCDSSELPTFEGVVVANEVLDALPCLRFEMQAGLPWQLGVNCNDAEAFSWQRLEQTIQADDALEPYLRDLPDGYRSEYNRRIMPWLTEISKCLNQGTILIFDYGYTRSEYYRPDRSDGTLTCHYRHQVHGNPLLVPGLQDITTWVDFTLTAQAASANGFEVAGFAPQAQFLLACGITDLLQARRGQAGWSQRELDRAKYLLMPNAMGERIKVMALARGLARQPRGFSLRNYIDRL
jgi:SAM-dependent MidA family methyltransferase